MCKPLLKWPGGKRWLAPKIVPHLNGVFSRYIEPFLGGGALLFALEPNDGIASDINASLIACYEAISEDSMRVLSEFNRLRNTKEEYYRARDEWQPTDKFQRAARFIYLLRYSWNGLYRVNREGHFNVPYSYRELKNGLTEDQMASGESILRRVTLKTQDFGKSIAEAREGHIIFVDPPYFERGRPTFTKYNPSAFGEAEQKRLAQALLEAESRGASWILTNGSVAQVQAGYQGYDIFTLPRHSVIAASSASRRKIKESIVLSNTEELDALRFSLKVQCEQLT